MAILSAATGIWTGEFVAEALRIQFEVHLHPLLALTCAAVALKLTLPTLEHGVQAFEHRLEEYVRNGRIGKCLAMLAQMWTAFGFAAGLFLHSVVVGTLCHALGD